MYTVLVEGVLVVIIIVGLHYTCLVIRVNDVLHVFDYIWTIGPNAIIIAQDVGTGYAYIIH